MIDTTINAQSNNLVGGSPDSTGLQITPGDHLHITVPVNELWRNSPTATATNAGGMGNPYGTALFLTDLISGQTFRYGSLVGRIGTGAYFYVGTLFDAVAIDSGVLKLLYWDNTMNDNSGSVTATVTLTPMNQCLQGMMVFTI